MRAGLGTGCAIRPQCSLTSRKYGSLEYISINHGEIIEHLTWSIAQGMRQGMEAVVFDIVSELGSSPQI